MGHNYIAPEHVAIALLSVDDGGASKVLDRFVLSVSSPTPPIAPAPRCCLRWVTRLCPG
jgi:hypothetical protein